MVICMYLKRIKELRIDRDVKQSTIASVLKVSQVTYSRYENNQRSLPLDLLVKLCKFYNVSADYILELK